MRYKIRPAVLIVYFFLIPKGSDTKTLCPPENNTVDAKFYENVLDRFWKEIARVNEPVLRKDRSFLSPHDIGTHHGDSFWPVKRF